MFSSTINTVLIFMINFVLQKGFSQPPFVLYPNESLQKQSSYTILYYVLKLLKYKINSMN